MVFQNYALYPHMTVRDNMAFSLMLAKKEQGRHRRARQQGRRHPRPDAAARPLPAPALGRPAPARRDGPRIVRDPQVFLFDEPLSNLDAKLRVAMRTEIKELHQRLKTTSIYVTHDQIEAMTMADQIVVMHDGRIEQIGSPLELYDRPANRFVAGFIGSPAMNFIDGTLQRRRASSRRRRRAPAAARRAGGATTAARWSTASGPSTSTSPTTASTPRWWSIEPTGSRDAALRAPGRAGDRRRLPRAPRLRAGPAHPAAPARRVRASLRPVERPTDLRPPSTSATHRSITPRGDTA